MSHVGVPDVLHLLSTCHTSSARATPLFSTCYTSSGTPAWLIEQAGWVMWESLRRCSTYTWWVSSHSCTMWNVCSSVRMLLNVECNVSLSEHTLCRWPAKQSSLSPAGVCVGLCCAKWTSSTASTSDTESTFTNNLCHLHYKRSCWGDRERSRKTENFNVWNFL